MQKNASVIYFSKKRDVHLSPYGRHDPIADLETEAREILERVLELDPDHEVARLCLGLLRSDTDG